VSDGPLRGPDGKPDSVAADVTIDDDEWVLWSGAGTDSGGIIEVGSNPRRNLL
jgi:hypothetical protein